MTNTSASGWGRQIHRLSPFGGCFPSTPRDALKVLIVSDREDDDCELDLAMMDDSVLVVLAQDCAYGAARNELILRYEGQRERLVSWLSRTTSFSPTDVEDARQNSVFWTVEAIKKYDTDQIAKNEGCSFFTFLNRVLVCRFKDYAKHLRRREQYIDRSSGYAADEGIPPAALCDDDDPAFLAESQESISRLHAAIAQLDSESCRMWELLSEGNSLREIAEELVISYDAAKRRRRKLINLLKKRLSAR